MDAILSKIINNLMIENVDNTAINDIVQQVRENWTYFDNVDVFIYIKKQRLWLFQERLLKKFCNM